MTDDVINVPGVPPPPLEMLTEVALGMEEGVDIAYRYGYSASEYKRLEEYRPFVNAVLQLRAEMEKDGHQIRAKARWMSDHMLDEAFLKAKAPGTTLPQVLDALKTFARIADLEPKQEKNVAAAGPGTSVQIIFSGSQADVVIGQTREEEKEPEPLTFDINMPEKPDGEN